MGRCWTLGSSRSPLAGRCLFRSNSGSQAQRHILLIAALRRQAQRHVAQLGYVARLLKKTKEWKITHERNRLKLINLFILFSLLILLANRYFNRSPQHNPVVLNRGSGDQHPLIPSPHPLTQSPLSSWEQVLPGHHLVGILRHSARHRVPSMLVMND